MASSPRDVSLAVPGTSETERVEPHFDKILGFIWEFHFKLTAEKMNKLKMNAVKKQFNKKILKELVASVLSGKQLSNDEIWNLEKEYSCVLMELGHSYPTIETMQKLALVKAYLEVKLPKRQPDHVVQETSPDPEQNLWMIQTEDIIRYCNIDLSDINRESSWVKISPTLTNLAKVDKKSITKQHSEAQEHLLAKLSQLLRDRSQTELMISFTDGSRCIGKCGWSFVVKQNIEGQWEKVYEMSGAYKVTVSAFRTEIEAVSKALYWIVANKIEHAVILTDCKKICDHIDKEKMRREWVNCLEQFPVKTLEWVYIPRRLNTEADNLAKDAVVSGEKLKMDRKDVEDCVRECLKKKKPERSAVRNGEGDDADNGVENSDVSLLKTYL